MVPQLDTASLQRRLIKIKIPATPQCLYTVTKKKNGQLYPLVCMQNLTGSLTFSSLSQTAFVFWNTLHMAHGVSLYSDTE